MRMVHNNKCKGGNAFDEVDGKTYCLGRVECGYEDIVYIDECKKCKRLLSNNEEAIQRYIAIRMKQHKKKSDMKGGENAE